MRKVVMKSWSKTLFKEAFLTLCLLSLNVVHVVKFCPVLEELDTQAIMHALKLFQDFL